MKEIRILSWNIAGWTKKSMDPDLVTLFRSHDLVLLQETWATTPIIFAGYKGLSLPALRTAGRGRPSGGLSILVADYITADLIFMADSYCKIQVIKLRGTAHELLVANVYLPPKPKNEEKECQWRYLNQIISDIQIKCPGLGLLIAGDFNSRVGTDSIIFLETFDQPLEDLPALCSLPRSSKDKVINISGTWLAKFCVLFGLTWINDLPSLTEVGEFTFLAPQGSSVIDYMLISSPLLSSTVNFHVCSPLHSDHLPLSGTFLFNLDIPSIPLTSPRNLHDTSVHLKWDYKTKTLFESIVNKAPLEILIAALLPKNLTADCFNSYEVLNNHLVEVLGQCSSPQLRASSSFTPVLPGTDETCQALKANIRRTYKDYIASKATALPTCYFTLCRQLRGAISQHLSYLHKKRWTCLAKAVLTNNSRSFWEMIAGAVTTNIPRPGPTVHAHVWISHFRSLFYDKNLGNPPSVTVNFEELPEWPPVEPSEVIELISQLKTGKAAGPDLIPSDLLKAAPSWWAPFLAKLFTLVNNTGCIPSSWTHSIVVPIYKKGDSTNPSNYRPISLLSIVGKLYASQLLTKLTAWLDSNNIIGPEQAGFRSGRSTLDHCTVLSYLISKQVDQARSRLYTAFLDLKAAFDSVNRNILWGKLDKFGIDPRLLQLIQKLYSNTSCRIRLRRDGTLSEPVLTNRGVKQGCVLAPTLFNLYINDLTPFLAKVDSHCPKIGSLPVPILLYADDMVLIPRTKIGLKRLIQGCISFLHTNQLQLNFAKSKIIVFGKSWRPCSWQFGRSAIQQVKSFKYLGILFHYKHQWSMHRIAAIRTAKITTQAIIRFFYTQGAAYIPAALRVFNAKVVNQLLYGSQIWLSAFNIEVERIQSSFLYKIFGLPHCVPYAALCLEAGQYRLQCLLWIRFFKFWLRMCFLAESVPFLKSILTDYSYCSGYILFIKKIQSIGLSPDLLGSVTLSSAIKISLNRLIDIERQDVFAAAAKSCSPLHLQLPCTLSKSPRYLFVIDNPQARRAFSLARCNALPSSLREYRFNRSSKAQGCCLCNQTDMETLAHVLLHCTWYNDLRQNILNPLLANLQGGSDSDIVQILLSSINKWTINQLAKFFQLTMERRAAIVSSTTEPR